MKGIILAGGAGSRLHPNTLAVSKQLLPIYDKPMIYYPLATLMQAGIRDILIITAPDEKHRFERLLGDGSRWGIKLEYIVQPAPDGLAQAFILGEEFIGDDCVCLILGDNIFYGPNLQDKLGSASKLKSGARVFAYHVSDPERYGVVEFDGNMQAVGLAEKPETPKSNWAVTGIYFYDNTVIEKAKSLTPSKRGELEITDINALYLADNCLSVEIMSQGYVWLDTGTYASMLDASNFVQTFEVRQGIRICAPEQVAYAKGYITGEQLKELAKPLLKSGYGQYLMSLVEEP